MSTLFEETGAADKRAILYDEWFRLERWERAAMLARDRLQGRLDYWQNEWAQGRGLPQPKVKRA